MTSATSNDEQPQNTSSQEYIILSSPSDAETKKTERPPGKLDFDKNKVLEEVFSRSMQFDASQMLSQPIQGEHELDKAFVRDQATELLEAMLETWAWSMSRITQTTQTSSQRLNEKYVLVVDTEKKQGMSDSLDSAHPRTSAPRLPGADWFEMASKQLQEFVRRVRSAIDALRGD